MTQPKTFDDYVYLITKLRKFELRHLETAMDPAVPEPVDLNLHEMGVLIDALLRHVCSPAFMSKSRLAVDDEREIDLGRRGRGSAGPDAFEPEEKMT